MTKREKARRKKYHDRQNQKCDWIYTIIYKEGGGSFAYGLVRNLSLLEYKIYLSKIMALATENLSSRNIASHDPQWEEIHSLFKEDIKRLFKKDSDSYKSITVYGSIRNPQFEGVLL